MLKHPQELGFTLGLKIRIDESASITTRTFDASMSDVVYVALFAEETTRLEKGEALKVGQTKGSLMNRWKGIAGTFKPLLSTALLSDSSQKAERAGGVFSIPFLYRHGMNLTQGTT
jgi:hypothetical protein